MRDEAAVKRHQEACNKTREMLSSGPWDQEPNFLEWEHAGLNCMIVRDPYGFNWCGYVGLPPSHPDFEKEYDDIEVKVHGGLTFGEKCNGHICHNPNNGDPDDLYWVGFDCAHAGDLSPGTEWLIKIVRPERPEIYQHTSKTSAYRDLKWVKAETESLAEQLGEK